MEILKAIAWGFGWKIGTFLGIVFIIGAVIMGLCLYFRYFKR